MLIAASSALRCCELTLDLIRREIPSEYLALVKLLAGVRRPFWGRCLVLVRALGKFVHQFKNHGGTQPELTKFVPLVHISLWRVSHCVYIKGYYERHSSTQERHGGSGRQA